MLAYELTAVLSLRNQMSKQLHRVAHDLRKFAKGSKSQLGMVAGGAVGIGAALGGLQKAMNFEEQMSSIKALTKSSEAEMKEIKDLALKTSVQTKYSAIETAKGIEELLRSGLDPATIKAGGLEAALNLATAGGLELGSAAEIMSTALNAYKDDAMSAADAADILAGTANASATSVEELRYSLAAVSSVASGVGMSFKDTNIAMGLFANSGLKGSDSGTSLKTMLSNLSPKTDAAYGAFEDLGLIVFDAKRGMKVLAEKGIKPASSSVNDIRSGLERLAMKTVGATKFNAKAKKEFANMGAVTGFMNNAFYDSKGNLEDLETISGALKKSLSGLTAEQRQNALYTMFGSDAIRAGNILYKEGAEGVKKFTSEMSKVTALNVAKEKMDNAAGSIEQLKGALEVVQISVMTPFLPLIKDAALSFANFVQGIDPEAIHRGGRKVLDAFGAVRDFVVEHPKLVRESLVALWSGYKAYRMQMRALRAVFFVFRIVESFRYGALGVLAAQWGLNAEMLKNPTTWIVAGISLAISGIVLLARNWDVVKARAYAMWQSMKDLRKGLPTEAMASIKSIVVNRWNDSSDAVKSYISSAHERFLAIKAKLFGFTDSLGAAFGFHAVQSASSGSFGGGGYSLSPRISQSYYHGIERVPTDRIARLHKGERILTAKEDRYYTPYQPDDIYIDGREFEITCDEDIDRVVDEIMREIDKKRALFY